MRNSLKLVLRKRFSYEICERFAQTFLQRLPKPSLLCQKDQAARFCSSFGTEPYIEFTFI
ncbi:hypothetical protein LEP1GSC016_2841 [Leptospira borgpetersenii serovar Hardjo-bovis str. Sponselee]|uniref:Uncharacterized protein n=1 Tax=Leptospira borgpetersenii serovar Hardjo-bovis str. Sponselee TaxID=1303729 RepID=M6BWJ6_LEPBO|nr:hypothetical protein LEP1GSC016_2841 [Leptospira borgpetersenii serovar Hardjo-bovis str. Sponselee]